MLLVLSPNKLSGLLGDNNSESEIGQVIPADLHLGSDI